MPKDFYHNSSVPAHVASSPEADRRFYEDTSGYTADNIGQVAQCTRLYYDTYSQTLASHFSHGSPITVLELGAGTCCLSLLLSQMDVVKEIHCFDISLSKMARLVELSSKVIEANPEKLKFHEGDFGAPLDFPDQSFDLIAFDAALHHTRSIWNTLAECRRLLRPHGMVVAQREQYLGTLTHVAKLNSLLATPEVQSGVSENAFLRKQYEYYFRANGFDVAFKPVAETSLQKFLRPFNGWIHSKWVILATKVGN